MECFARSTNRIQPPVIVLPLSLLPTSPDYFPTATKKPSQTRSLATKCPTAATTGVRPKTNRSNYATRWA
jgi:hypothetical protein